MMRGLVWVLPALGCAACMFGCMGMMAWGALRARRGGAVDPGVPIGGAAATDRSAQRGTALVDNYAPTDR